MVMVETREVSCFKNGVKRNMPITIAVDVESEQRSFIVNICDSGDGSETCTYCVNRLISELRKNPHYFR